MIASNSPLVSILTPTFNHEKFIGECIASVLQQTMTNWEMIIIDDGSTDRTVEIALAVQDSRVKVISLHNRGIMALGDTYNVGLKQASGAIVAILEGDDFWPLDKLEIQCPDFDDETIVLSSGMFVACEQNRELVSLLPNSLPPVEVLQNKPTGLATLAMMDPRFLTFTFPVSTLIRRSALDRIGGFIQPDYLPLVDYPTFMSLGLEGQWKFHRKILGFWRRHGGSITKSRFPQILDGAYQYSQYFAANNSDRVPFSSDQLAKIDSAWLNRQTERSIVLHRFYSENKNYRMAARVAHLATNYPLGAKSRLLLKLARSFSLLHVPTEFIFRLARRGDWKVEFESATGERIVDPDGGLTGLKYRAIGPVNS